MPGKIEVVWEDPPEVAPNRTLAQLITALEQLKTRPNTWARIGEWTGESSGYTNKRLLEQDPPPPWMPRGHFEYKVVREPSGETKGGRTKNNSKLYARYLSKPAE